MIKKSELDVQSHSNRPSTSKESNGTKNGDPHNDSNIPPASTAAVAETTEQHTGPWCRRRPEEATGARRTPESVHRSSRQTGDGHHGSTSPGGP